MKKELLKQLGEETIYTAKGHFKACDIRRNLVTWTIWLCLVLNLVSLFDIGNKSSKVLSVLGIFGTIALLIWNEGDGKTYKERHRLAGEQYLSLYKEIRDAHILKDNSKEKIKALSEKVRALDLGDRPEISWAARKLAQWAIKKGGETNNWFKDGHK